MFNIFKKKPKTSELFAPVNGKTIDLTTVPDPVFAQKMMGDGIAFEYEGNVVCSPCDGKVTMIFPTKHAFGITTDAGVEILIHIGFDTVNLNGEGFTQCVEQGTSVKAGTPIIKIDREFMKEKGINLITPMVITNGQDFDLVIEDFGKDVKVKEDKVITCTKK